LATARLRARRVTELNTRGGCTALRTNDKGEHEEAAEIYADRGVDPALAKKVADQLMTYDALGPHACDELDITPTPEARPIRAAAASAASFILGAAAISLIVVAWSRRRVS
jgi:vacuolar iron transporter family protein